MSENNVANRKRVIRRQHNLNNESSSMINSNQMTNARKKPEGLICSVCEGPAHGYNFDTITCESCKAFFRRNALRNDVSQLMNESKLASIFWVLFKEEISMSIR